MWFLFFLFFLYFWFLQWRLGYLLWWWNLRNTWGWFNWTWTWRWRWRNVSFWFEWGNMWGFSLFKRNFFFWDNLLGSGFNYGILGIIRLYFDFLNGLWFWFRIFLWFITITFKFLGMRLKNFDKGIKD